LCVFNNWDLIDNKNIDYSHLNNYGLHLNRKPTAYGSLANKISKLVLLDLSKAFDSINHHRLLHKLANVGASPATVQWFKSYLPDRFQSTRIKPTLSDPLPITHGVPQGATLSPLSFCIYLNDLPSVSRDSNLESYVDDSKVLLSFHITSDRCSNYKSRARPTQSCKLVL
jgi:hypothetical protein